MILLPRTRTEPMGRPPSARPSRASLMAARRNGSIIHSTVINPPVADQNSAHTLLEDARVEPGSVPAISVHPGPCIETDNKSDQHSSSGQRGCENRWKCYFALNIK